MMGKGPLVTLSLLLYIIYNHPLLFKSSFLQYIYYILILLTTLFESYGIFPCKNHVEYFRRVKGETCMIGIIILPAVSASFSMMWHINFLSFSILSLILYLSFNHTKRYLVRIAYLTISFLILPIMYYQYEIIMNKPFTILLFIYHITSLITFERIFNTICIYFTKTFTFSDTVVVSGMIYFVFEQCVVLTVSCFVDMKINYFKARLIIHEYHIISICMIGYAMITSITILPWISNQYKLKSKINRSIHIFIFIANIVGLIIWINFILSIRCSSYPHICSHPTLLSAIIDVLAYNNHYFILLYWIGILITFFVLTPVPNFEAAIKDNKSITIIRKYFHGWCLILFLPIIKWNSIYLSLSFSIALWLFITVESVRVCNLFFIGHYIEKYCRPFLDERDGGKLVLTHVWLLIGCAIPLWYSFIIKYDGKYNDIMDKIYGVSGIIILGIGDALAAIIGSKFGSIKWPNSNKTFEGTMAGIISSVILYVIMFYNDNVIDFDSMILNLIQVLTATFILEAITKQIDNLYLPLFCCLFMDVTFVS